MKSHIKSDYARGLDQGRREAIILFLLAIHNLHGWGWKPLSDLVNEVGRLSAEAAGDPDWVDRVRQYFARMGVKI